MRMMIIGFMVASSAAFLSCAPTSSSCAGVDPLCNPYLTGVLYSHKDRSKVVPKYMLAAASGSMEVHLYNLDRDSGALGLSSSITVGTNPQPAGISGHYYYVPNNGSSNVSMLSFAGGSLTSLGTIGTNANPTFAAVHPYNGRVYVGSFSGNIEIFQQNTDGTLTSQTNFNTGSGGTINLLVFIHDGATALVTDANTHVLRQYDVNSDGTLSLTAQPATGTQPSTIDLDREKRFAYVPNQTSNDITVFDLISGTASPKHSVSLGVSPTTSFLSPGPGNFLFTSANTPNELYVHRVDHDTGNLTQVDKITGFNGIILTKVEATGNYAYVSETLAGTISTYVLDRQTGGLTLSSSVAVSNPSFIDFVNEVVEE